MTPLHRLRTILLPLALALAATAPAIAQHGRDVPPPPLAGSPNASNPTADSVSEDALLQRLQKLEGRVTIPDGKAAVLEQPQGREYRGFREQILPWLGGVAILGMFAALGAFYFTKGTIRLNHGEQSGEKIQRFNAFERFTHWLTAICFIALSVSGLNYIFGKRLLNGMQIAQYVHAGVGVLLIAAMLAHIYIGSLGMEGAYDAMGSGQVDLAWAKTHHKLWVEEEQAKTASGRQLPPGGAIAPAE